MTKVYPLILVFTLILNHVISYIYPLSPIFSMDTSLSDFSKIILLVAKLDTCLLILVLTIMDICDQELSIALEEFERTMVDGSDLFLSLLENRLRGC